MAETPSIEHPGFLPLLLTHLLRSTRVLDKVAHVLEPEDFYRNGEEGYQVVWAIVREYWSTYKRAITKDVLYMLLETRLAGDPEFLDVRDAQALVEDIDVAFEFPEDQLVPDWIVREVQYFLDDRRLRGAAKAMADALPESLERRMQELVALRASSQLATGRLITSFMPGQQRLEQQARTPTGCNYFDLLLGGGIREAEVYGLMGPTGKGKTTMAVQVMWSAVREGIESAYFAYENPFEPEYTTRFYGYMANLPAARIQGLNWDQLNPDDQHSVSSELERFGSRFHPFDMVGGGGTAVGCGGVDEIRAHLSDLANRGHPVRLAVIDQHLPFVDRYMAVHPCKLERREMLQRTVDDLMKVATEFRTAILLLHQVSPEYCDKPPYIRPVLTAAAECRSWAFWMTNCLVIGNHDRESRCWLVSAKARGARTQEIILRMLGDRFRFDFQAGLYVCHDRKFVESSELTAEGTVPARASQAYHTEGEEVLR